MNANENTVENTVENKIETAGFKTIDSEVIIAGENAARIYRIICEERLRRAQNKNKQTN